MTLRRGEMDLRDRRLSSGDPTAHVRGFAVALLLSLYASLHAQSSAPAPDSRAPAPDSSSSSQPAPSQTVQAAEDPRRAEAAKALGRGDFPLALKLLLPLAADNPSDARVLFDLASAQDALSDSDAAQIAAAEQSYRRSIAADPAYFEPHLALGLLFARNNRLEAARSELVAATTLHASNPDLKARAYRALARVDLTLNPAEARDALLQTLKLSPETPDDTLLAATLAEQSEDPAAAEASCRRLLAATPNDPSATAALARLLLRQGNAAEAESLLKSALATHPDDSLLLAQFASVALKQNKPAEALSLLRPVQAEHPDNKDLARLYAHLLTATGDYSAAEPVLAALSAQSPADPGLADDVADVLIHLRRFPEAEAILTRSLEHPELFPTPASRADAASHLAFAASQNSHPEVVLQALSVRATLLPQSPSSLFLAATAHDRLHHTKVASDLYRQFLLVAKGKFPDEESEARHRLLALAHTR